MARAAREELVSLKKRGEKRRRGGDYSCIYSCVCEKCVKSFVRVVSKLVSFVLLLSKRSINFLYI